MTSIDAAAERAPAEALAEALARDDLEAAAAIVGGDLYTLLQTDWRGLIAALERLPDEFIRTNPIFGMIRDFGGSVRLSGGAVNREVVPALRADEIGVPGVPDRILDGVLLQELLAHRFRGDFVAAKSVGEQLRSRILRADERGRRPLHEIVSLSALHIGIAEVLAGDLEQGLRDFSDARILRAEGQHDMAEQDADLKAAVVHAALGRLGEADRLLRRAAALPAPGASFADFLVATRSAASALIAVDRLAPDAADLVAEAVDRNANDELWAFTILAATRWGIVNGDLAGALDRLDRVAAFQPLPEGSLAASVTLAARAQALVMLGEFGAAAQALDDGGDRARRDAAVVRVRLAMHTEGPEAALAAARRLVVRRGIGPVARAETMLLAAWAQQLLLGAPESGIAGPLGSLIAREGLWRVLQLVPTEVVAAIPGLGDAPAFERRLVVPGPGLSTRLTPNELEILRLLAGTASLPSIAKARFVTLNTVKTQVASIYRRLGVHSRREAVAEAMRRGLLDGLGR